MSAVNLLDVLLPILAGESEDHLRHDAWSLLVLVGGLFEFWLSFVTWQLLGGAFTVPGFDEAGKALSDDVTQMLIDLISAFLKDK